MDSKDLLLDSLDQRGAAYRENLKLSRDEFSQKAIHDLRTSIRRLLATLDVTAFITSRSRAEKLSDKLKDQLDGLDDLRDTQVMLEEVSERIATLPELEPFQGYLEKREKKQERAAEKHLEEIKPGRIEKQRNKLFEAVEDLSPEDLHGKLPQTVDEAYLTVMQRYGEVDPAQVSSIHRLRVAFKNFRYMVESIYPCLPDFPESQLERMHDYHNQMGHIHDLQVLLETLQEYAQESESFDPQSVRRYYERLLAEALSAFLKNKDEALTFWRTSPLEAFPWEGDRKLKEE